MIQHLRFAKIVTSGSAFIALLAVLLTAAFSANAQTSLPYTTDFSTDPFTEGWIAESVTGDQTWTYNGNFQNASMSAFVGGTCLENEDWLITPSFDLSQVGEVGLSADVQRGFGGDNPLELLFSTNYSGSGDPNAADWTLVETIIASDFETNNTSVTFGPYDVLNNVDDDAVYVAFRFAFEDGSCSTWRVAGLSISGGTLPAIAASESIISGLNYEEGSGPSASASYEMTINNFEGDGEVLVSAPENFEVSKDDVVYSSSLNFSYTAGDLTEPGLIYVRLMEGLPTGNYTGAVAHTSGDLFANVTVNGSVSFVAPAESYFIDFEGEGEEKGGYATGNVVLSGLEWQFTEALIGSLDNDFKNGIRSARLRGRDGSVIEMTQDKPNGIAAISFLYRQYGSDSDQQPWAVEYSQDGGSNWTQIGANIQPNETVQTFNEEVNVGGNIRIRVRLTTQPGTSGNRRFNIDEILITDSDAAGAPGISANLSNLAMMDYEFGNGPSNSTFYSFTGANLSPESGNIEVTAPANFELSTDGGTWTSTLTAPYSEGALDDFEVLVRLAEGLEVGAYSGEITHTGGGASANVPVSGMVTSGTVLPDFLPEAFDLSSGNYDFNAWDSLAMPLEYPDNMRFYWSNNPSSPEANDLEDGTGLYDCAYNLTSRPRINGLGENGFSFITTGSPQRNNCVDGEADEDRFVGSAVVALNTVGVTEAHITWNAWLVVEGMRNFGIRLQYRLTDQGEYLDFAEPTTFASAGLTAGAQQAFTLSFPQELLGQEAVYLRFVYFEIPGESGSRPELAIESFSICPCPPLSTADVNTSWFKAYPNPASDQVFINLNDAEAGVYQMQLFNINGKVVKEAQIVHNGQQTELDLKGIPAGMYFLTATSASGNARTVKIVKR